MEEPRRPDEFPEETTVGRMVWNRARRLRDRDFIRYHDGEHWRWLTWGRYGEIVEEIACGLADLGLARGAVAGILSATRLEWGLADLGILTCGAATVTVYPTLVPADVAYILGHSEASVVFVEDAAQLARVRAVQKDLPRLQALVVLSGETDGGADAMTLDTLRERGRTLRAKRPGLWRERIEAAQADDLATLVYTSGTTGPPKGVMLTHANFMQTVKGLERLRLVTSTDHAISYLPLAHIYERISTYMFTMYIGGTYGIARSMDTLVEDIQVLAPTVMVGVPRVYEKIHAGILRNLKAQSVAAQRIFHWALAVGRRTRPYRQVGKPLPALLALQHALAERLVYAKIRGRFGGRLRFLVSAAAPIAAEILEFFDALGIPIVEGYGMTECTGPATLANLQTMRIGYVGRALDGTEIRIAEDGEILVRGYNVCAGYYRQPEATAEALVSGWLHTGDIGEMTADGYLKITDRKKDLIVTAGGKNIAPQNIENRFKLDPFIAEAFVFGDRKPYLTALFTVEEAMVRQWAAGQGIAEENLERLLERPEVRRMLGERIEAVNRELARFETIKKYRILPTQFTIEGGELTPTMKLKRKAVYAKYGKLLEALYDGKE